MLSKNKRLRTATGTAPARSQEKAKFAKLSSSEGSESEQSGISESDTDNEFTDNHSVIALDPENEAALHEKIAALPASSSEPGVLYLGRIPHGFYEDEMRAYFSQFGTVTRLRLSRNRKTGKSKHYAFIEFKSREVAEVVADTMNNFLLFNHILKCTMVPPEKVHERLFVGANRKYRAVPTRKIAREMHNRPKTRQQVAEQQKRLVGKEDETRKKLKELGIDYEFPGYAAQVVKEPEHTRFSDT